MREEGGKSRWGKDVVLFSLFQKDANNAECIPFFARKLGHHKSHIPRKEWPLKEIICLYSPFSSDIFYYIQLNKYSLGQAPGTCTNQEPVELSSTWNTSAVPSTKYSCNPMRRDWVHIPSTYSLVRKLTQKRFLLKVYQFWVGFEPLSWHSEKCSSTLSYWTRGE